MRPARAALRAMRMSPRCTAPRLAAAAARWVGERSGERGVEYVPKKRGADQGGSQHGPEVQGRQVTNKLACIGPGVGPRPLPRALFNAAAPVCRVRRPPSRARLKGCLFHRTHTVDVRAQMVYPESLAELGLGQGFGPGPPRATSASKWTPTPSTDVASASKHYLATPATWVMARITLK